MSHGSLLEIKDLKTGDGPAAQIGDVLRVDYRGTLFDDPSLVFDESFSRASPFAMTLGVGQVIAGWDQGLVGMRVGGERELTIPPELAYGSLGVGKIPANATLVFRIRLLDAIPGPTFKSIADAAIAEEEAYKKALEEALRKELTALEKTTEEIDKAIAEAIAAVRLYTTSLLGGRSVTRDDRLQAPASTVNSYQIWGYDGDDSLGGGPQPDVLLGGSDDDRVDGAGSDDIAHGGDGKDTLIGGDGNDTLIGGPGDDSLVGGGQPEDRAVFSGEWWRYRLRWRRNDDPATTELMVESGSSNADGKDALTGVRQLQFSDRVVDVDALFLPESGSVNGYTLGRVRRGYAVSGAAGPPRPVTWGSGILQPTTLPDWELLAAARFDGSNRLLWRNRTSASLVSWSLDDNWTANGATDPVAVSSADSRRYERQFFLDLDGDGIIGASRTTVSRTDQLVLQHSSDSALSLSSSGKSLDLLWGGSALRRNDSRLPGWSALSAASVDGISTLLWRQDGSGDLATWSFDAKGNATGGTAPVSSRSDSALRYEGTFTFDINGDGVIGNPYSTIAANASLALLRHSSTRQLAIRNGDLTLDLRWGNTPLIDADPRLPEWTPLAVARLNGIVSLLWRQKGSGNLATWSFDDAGNATGGTAPVASDSPDALGYEGLFNVDANSDGSIGSKITYNSLNFSAPQAFSVLRDSSNRWTVTTQPSSSRTILSWAGAPITFNDPRLPGWQPVAASVVDGRNSLLWKHELLSLAAVWSFDAAWNASGGFPAVSLASNAGRDLENIFNTDLNGDRSIGSSFNVIDSRPSPSLLTRSDDRTLAVATGNGGLFSLSWGGAPLQENDSRLPGWKALGAARINDTNQLLWRQAANGNLATWTFDNLWNPTGGTPIITADSAEAINLEIDFGIDANGDRTIGTPYATIASNGTINLQRHSSSGRLAVSSNGGTPIPLSWGGSDLLDRDSRLPGWTAIAAARINGINQLLWRQAATGSLTTWTFDDRWNPAGGTPIVAAGSDDAIKIEDSYGRDANGDGFIGEPLSPITNLRNRILAANPLANARDPFSSILSGSPSADILTAPESPKVLITGFDLLSGLALPAGAIDQLDLGISRSDTTVLLASTTGQPFASDGDSGYTLIRNFDDSDDDLVISSDIRLSSAIRSLSFQGSTVNGIGLHVDTNANNAYDSGDNLIALLAGVGSLPSNLVRI